MNCVQLTGRLSKNPDVRTTTTNKKVANFSIAVNDKSIGQVDYIDIVVWGNIAESVEKYLQKGSKINVVGKLRQNKYQDSSDNLKVKIYVLATSIDFLANTKEVEEDDDKMFNKIF